MANVTVRLDVAKLEALQGISIDGSWIIHDQVDYGVYQEFTGSGHPSLRPAFERVTRPIADVIEGAIEGNVNLDTVLGKMAADIARLWADDVNIDTGAYRGGITWRKE